MSVDEELSKPREQCLRLASPAGFQREVPTNMPPPTRRELPGDIQHAIQQLVPMIDKYLAGHR